MPRDLPLGNGSLLVTFDATSQLRDLYWPHVGLENHTAGRVFRAGVWVDGVFRWFDDPGWSRQMTYATDTLVGEILLSHGALQLELLCRDAVDFHENLYLRQIEIRNPTDRQRDVRLFFHHDFHISSHRVGDTAYYEPERRGIFHYKGARWFLINSAVPGKRPDDARDTVEGWHIGLSQWACGHKRVGGLEGTWKDAEDGVLSGNPIVQGSVDSTVAVHVTVSPRAHQTAYYWLAVGSNFEEVTRLNRLVRRRGPWTFIDRTAAYWHLWLDAHRLDFADLPQDVSRLYQLSLLIVRTQIDHDGAILAANDSDIATTVRDTYSYMWPRDGSLVAHALDLAGYLDITRNFFNFCRDVLSKEGYLLHKYNPDKTLASSWHPWVRNSRKDLPIQEDETALVLWSLWHHFDKWRDIEFIKPLYRSLIIRAADFLASYRDRSGLPRPSYDLWEERWGVSAFTTATVWAGLMAASKFAVAFGETALGQHYADAAAQMKAGAEAVLYQPRLGRFVRQVTPTPEGAGDGPYEIDETLDASLYGLWYFGLFAPDDPRIVRTMEAMRDRLWIKTAVGGMARYENDYYQQQSQDIAHVPGNPWFICTLWLALWSIATAKSREGLKPAVMILEWCAHHGLPSGVLPEQVHPDTHAPLSVSPLTWSHATFVTAVQEYLRRWKQLR
ncbi:MAG TPA: glycoside hydrolase family 15 protein [Nitrospiraceae bacterium]|jgi:GH15 family glucan-1,4-alpha-glucosidase|nr:glycoside hydrolase family 15 protein [Nitrospiraceae bacterium]